MLFCLYCSAFGAGNNHVLTSPDGKLKVTTQADRGGLFWSVDYDGETVMKPSPINISIDGRPCIDSRLKESNRRSVSTSFATPFYKKARVEDRYQTLTLRASRDISVEFRAYDDGAAYRLVYNGKKPVVVNSETAEFRFTADHPCFVPYVNDNRSGERYCYSFESYYDEVPMSQIHRDSLSITPLAVCLPSGTKAIVMDAGVENYPGMMLLASETSPSLRAVFAPYPTEQVVGGFDRLNLVPTKRTDYIAKLSGQQALPWRAVVVTRRDADILNCDMAQRLAPACRLKDTSWIRPGKVAWDWWNNTNLTGVDFVSGMNTRTYKYYIDFAQRNHLEYIIIDEGWSGKESLTEQLNPDIQLDELIAYARRAKGGVSLEKATLYTDMAISYTYDLILSGRYYVPSPIGSVKGRICMLIKENRNKKQLIKSTCYDMYFRARK